MKLIKGVFKFVLIAVVILVVAASFNVVDINKVVPSKYANMINQQVEVVNQLKSLAASTASENIKLTTENNKTDVKLKINNEWYSFSDLEEINKTATGKMSVVLNGESVEIVDNTIKEALNTIIDSK